MINLNNINRSDLASLRPDIQKQWIKENYIMFNALYFNNELPDIDEIKFTAIKRSNVIFLGKAYNSYPFEIKLNFRYHLVEIEWQNVVLHEMVHIWQYINGYEGGHGKTFKKKAKEINKYGWDITTYYKNILQNIDDYDEYRVNS